MRSQADPPMRFSVDIPRDTSAPAVARAAVRSLEEAMDPLDVSAVCLLVSELVTNSVKYGEGPTVRVLIDDRLSGRLQIAVLDDGSGFVPRPRTRPATEAGGWGLHLVDELSDGWGVDSSHGAVWFSVGGCGPELAAA